MEQKDWISLGRILSSNYKREVLLVLKEKEATPKLISKKTHFSINHISGILKELKKLELIKCLNEDLKKGRIYQLTEKGKKLIDKIESLDSDE